jgi:nucleotide-binding universal stress UspA family protein
MVPPGRGHRAPDRACPPRYGECVNASQIFIIVALAWGLLGVSTALVMGRRGHQPFMWLMLAIVFGPLVLPLAVNALIHDRPGLFQRLSTGRRGAGNVDVLAGTDGSPEAESACRSAIHMLGSRLGRLTLAAVVDYDVAVGSGLAEENERARTGLMRTADATGLRPETLLLSGRPAEVLRKYAVEEGYDLIVVGRRGHGASRLLLGSVADALARGGEVPVLIV